MKIGDSIKELRLQEGLSQKDLSIKSGLSEKTIKPHSTVTDLAKFLG